MLAVGPSSARSTTASCISTRLRGERITTPGSTLNYCCTTPLPTGGTGNIALDPQLASASHLSADSPCRGAGSAAYATGTDIDGEPWGNPPSIGCDEFHAGAVTGPLTVSLLANYTNVAVGYSVSFTALIEGRTTESVWDFGDGDVAINQPYVTHGWTEAGDYLVGLWAFNESQFERGERDRDRPCGSAARVLCCRYQHQPPAALRLLGHGSHEHSGGGGCGVLAGGRECW